MDRRTALYIGFSILAAALCGGQSSPAWAKGSGSDGDSSGPGGNSGPGGGHGGDDHGGDDHGGDDNGGDDNGGDDNGSDDNGGRGRGSDDPGGGHGRSRNEPGGAERSGPARIDTVSVSYRDGRREQVVQGRFMVVDRSGRVVVDRAATRADLSRLAGTRLGSRHNGAVSEQMVRMNSRTGAAEILDRRGWREVMDGRLYWMTDPKGRVVRSRSQHPADIDRVRGLLKVR